MKGGLLMNIRMVKVDEFQFLVCLKNGLWASNKNLFKNWGIGDIIIFNVDKNVTAYAKVNDISFYSEDFLWDIDLFPYRIPISFESILKPENRIPIISEIKELLIKSWGNNYGWGMNCQYPMRNKVGEELISIIDKSKNDIDYYRNNINIIIDKIRQERIELSKESNVKFKRPIVDL